MILSVIVIAAELFAFVHEMYTVSQKLNFFIFQGSVATCLRWGGSYFVCSLSMQKFWKSVKIWQSYKKFKGGDFFETQCMHFNNDLDCWRSATFFTVQLRCNLFYNNAIMSLFELQVLYQWNSLSSNVITTEWPKREKTLFKIWFFAAVIILITLVHISTSVNNASQLSSNG